MYEEDKITADLMDIRRKRSIGGTSTGSTGAPLSTTTASLLLTLPLLLHWFFLILLYARLNIVSFWNLSFKDKVLHMLSNILVTLPVRKTKEGRQVHKAREIFWSLFLVGLNLLATALITSALINKNWYLPQHSTYADNSMFFESSAGPGVKYSIPKFFFIFGLPSLLCHLVASLLLLLQYKLVHPWRLLGRDREANCWGRLGGTKRGIHEETPQWRSSHMVSTQIMYFPTLSFLRNRAQQDQRVPPRRQCPAHKTERRHRAT